MCPNEALVALVGVRKLLWDARVALVGYSCRTLLWGNLMGHSCGTLLQKAVVGHSCGTLLQGTLLLHTHSCGTLLWVAVIGHSSRKLWWDTFVGHSCGAPFVGHSCGILLQDTLVGHSCRQLFWKTLVGHSCGTLLRGTCVGHSYRTLLLHSLMGHSCGSLLHYGTLLPGTLGDPCGKKDSCLQAPSVPRAICAISRASNEGRPQEITPLPLERADRPASPCVPKRTLILHVGFNFFFLWSACKLRTGWDQDLERTEPETQVERHAC